jgi:hypothetical protein
MTDQREPTLDELLSEPIIQQVMLSDGVRADDIRYLMRKATIRHGREFDEFPVISAYPQFSMPGRAAPAV